MTAAFEAEAIVKRFPGVLALDHVSLVAERGTVHALLGENGAGKSTLIKVITGVHAPDDGVLRVAGEPVTFANPQQATAGGIGVVHQERNLIPGFSIAENVMLQQQPSRRGLLDRATMRAEARRWLGELELDLDVDRPVSTLSVAQMQLVEIAKALSMQSDVLLLDEPTASITPNEADELFAVLRRLRDSGTAILFVSHKLEEVYAICDTVTVLRDGKTVLSSAPLADHPREGVVDLMVGRAYQQVELAPRPAPEGTTPALELNGVSTASGHRDVSLVVRAGEIVGLYGLVGAGRTELAKAILGLDTLTEGTIAVDGNPARIRDVQDAKSRYRIGYVTENRKEEGLFLDQTVRSNVAATVWERLRRWFGWVPRKAERELAEDYVERLGIKVSSVEQLAGQLSGGNQQKISLAKWLAARARILIIDEPTVGIDVRTKGAFHELIWELAREGVAVLLITSDLPEMITLADRILVMNSFQVVGEIANDHDYDVTSAAIIRLIHDVTDETSPVVAPSDHDEEGSSR